MGPSIDISVLELLASKICHDLISPVGAVANGVEFMEEMGADADEEVTNLIKFSAVQASTKLQIYRTAYGAGGADTSIKPEDIHKSFGQLISLDNKIKQDWDPHAPIGPEERPAGFCKMLMTTFILCVECLPKGGTISVEGEDDGSVLISASGENAAISTEAASGLENTLALEAVTPRLVHAYMCGLLCQHHQYTLSKHASEEGKVTFKLSYTAD